MLTYSLVFLAAAVGGAINAVAGGGTLITFPAVVGLGVPPLAANATSTVALWPGSLAGMWGFRSELAGTREWLLWFTAPSILGGITGALLLLYTPAGRFEEIVPFLVLGATLLFLAQRTITRALARHAVDAGEQPPATTSCRARRRGFCSRSSAWQSMAAISARESASSCSRPSV